MYLTPYLTFNGNCKQAMEFYQQCLGGVLQFETLVQSPLSDQLPQAFKTKILHASLTNGTFKLLATDMVAEDTLVVGNSVSLLLQCQHVNQLTEIYDRLSVHGKKMHDPQKTNNGNTFGSLLDQFGKQWLLNYNIESTFTSSEKWQGKL